MIDPDTDLVVKLANGEEVTIYAGDTSGFVDKVYTDADITTQANITNSFDTTTPTSWIVLGGTEYEKLVPTGETNVDVDYAPTISSESVTVNEDDLTLGTDLTKESTVQTGTITVSAADGISSLTIGGLSVITNDVFASGTAFTVLGNSLSLDTYDSATGVITYTYTLLNNQTHPDADGRNIL